jgi:hypothetical protein
MSKLVEILTAPPVACSEAEKCLNSPDNRGDDSAECRYCKYADEGGGSADKWKPWNRIAVHPKKLAEKRVARQEKLTERAEKRRTSNKGKKKQYASAARAEKRTERSLVKGTVNSGRKNQDGDHDMGSGRIALDTKEQKTRVNPEVDLVELDKIRLQAKASGHVIGALMLRNKDGRGVLVMDEHDYTRYFTRLVAAMARELVEA